MGKHTIACSDNERIVGVNEDIVLCTVAEYKIMKLLLHQKPVTDLVLTQELFNCSPDKDTKYNLRKYIEHLREKIEPMGLGIPRVQGYGYLLVELP